MRKMAYKCLSQFVKRTSKLEFVLALIIQHGFMHKQDRARQHSMLVIPVMLSLNPTVIKNLTPTAVSLLEAVTVNLNDEVAVVQRTGRRLLLELKKHFEDFLPSLLRQFESAKLMQAANEVLKFPEIEVEADSKIEEEEESD